MKFKATLDGQGLVLFKMSSDHNHEVSEAEFKFAPKQRIVGKEVEKEIAEMVSLNANRKKIQQLYAEKTGKAILMKDIHNIATRAKQQKREDNGTVSNNNPARVKSSMAKVFKEKNSKWEDVKVILTDNDMVKRGVFKSEMPRVNMEICLFHVLLTFGREITLEKMGVTLGEKATILDKIQDLHTAGMKKLIKPDMTACAKSCQRLLGLIMTVTGILFEVSGWMV